MIASVVLALACFLGAFYFGVVVIAAGPGPQIVGGILALAGVIFLCAALVIAELHRVIKRLPDPAKPAQAG